MRSCGRTRNSTIRLRPSEMRVLLFTHIFPSTQYPIRGPYNHYVFRALADRHDMRLIAPSPWWTRLRRPNALLRAPEEHYTGIEASFPTYWSVPGVSRMHANGVYHSLARTVRRLHR